MNLRKPRSSTDGMVQTILALQAKERLQALLQALRHGAGDPEKPPEK